MTTLQEAARDALEALERIGKDFVCRSAHHAKKDQHSAFAECPVVVRHTDAIESLRTALAQQGEQQVCAGCGIPVGDVHMSTCKSGKWPSRVSNGDTAAPAPVAQQGEQAKPAAYITDTWQGPMVWTPEMYNDACTYCDDGEFPVPLYTVAPRPTSGDYALGYAEGFNDACKPAPQPAQGVPETNFGNMQVQAVYALLCDPNEQPPEGEHWEGFMARRIVSVLQSAQPVAPPLTLEQILDIVKKLDETPDMSHVDVLKTFARAIEAAHDIREVK